MQERTEFVSREGILADIQEDIDFKSLTLTEDANNRMNDGLRLAQRRIRNYPAANVVQEENILKFYYVRSIDEYWIGRRLDNFYYARYESENQQWVWAYSRYLPWGEHVVSPTSLWKEHTYPSEPEEISFTDWLKGFSQKYVAADVRPVVRGKWKFEIGDGKTCVDGWVCTNCNCGFYTNVPYFEEFNFCPNCGAEMSGSQTLEDAVQDADAGAMAPAT